MNRIATPIITQEQCSYGCGNVARFINKSKKLMCQDRSTKCPAVKEKIAKERNRHMRQVSVNLLV